jgi:AcrR family transcriptional regulator
MEKQARIDEVYRAALRTFGKYGFRKATMEDIADELMLTKGALYQYAENKKDLYEKSAAYGLLQWQSRVMDAVSKETDAKEQFITMCKKAFTYLSEDNDLKKVLKRDPDIFPISFQKDTYKVINDRSMNLIKTILVKGIQEGKFRDVDTELITRLLFSIYKMLINETYILGDESPEQMLDEVIRLITEGFFLQRPY